jgi:hypothetical protein
MGCGCEDMAKRSCGDFFAIFGKWLGVFLEIFKKLGVFSEFSWTVT